ncbi:MAG: penicillin-binding protein activator [Desulfobacterales bacterium]|nr:penicillin-binding protein activator [Desulfobacterales bacterium]
MKIKFRFICFLLGLAFCVSSCQQKIVQVVPYDIPADAGYKLFSSAEKLMDEGAYNKAFEVYSDLMEEYPGSPWKIIAMLRTGEIYSETGNFEKAKDVFRKVIEEEPDSIAASDARINILSIYYNEGRYSELVNIYDTQFYGHILDSRKQKALEMVGDAYLYLGNHGEALYYYGLSFSGIDEAGKDELTGKISLAISDMNADYLLATLSLIDKWAPSDKLTFLMGSIKAENLIFEDAHKLLSVYIQKYPEGDDVIAAKRILSEIEKSISYNRYKIGCLLPLSGAYKTFGDKILNGVQLAFLQFSMSSNNPFLEIVIKDTQSDPQTAVAAVKELAEEGVAAIIGPVVSAEQAAKVAQTMGIPIITLTHRDNIVNIGDMVFRNFLTPHMQVSELVSYAGSTLGINRYAILYPDEQYGKTYMNLFWDEVIKSGGTVVGVESYDPDKTDFSTSIKKLVGLYYDVPEDLKELEPVENSPVENSLEEESSQSEEPEAIVDFDAVFIPDAPAKAGLILPQLAYYDVKDIYLLGTNLWHSETLIKMAHKYAQGAVIPVGFSPESLSENVVSFVNSFERTYGRKPDLMSAISYDTAMILFDIINRPDVRFRRAIVDKLLDESFVGVTGVTSFGEDGDAQKNPYLLRIKGKQFVELGINNN